MAHSNAVSTYNICNHDTSTLANIFKSGTFYGHSRYFFMATDNGPGQSDYFANAIGLGIGYETPYFFGFKIGLSGYFINNIGSSDLSIKDSIYNQTNRYEIGLFDIENPYNRHDLDRLEDLYIRYENSKSFIQIGKQHYNSPFINAQDGRMRPTLVEGIYSEWNEIKSLKFHAALLWEISPRSTVQWYTIGKSIGIYSSGISPDGAKSGYSGNVESQWLFVVGIEKKIKNILHLQAWNQYVNNVFNTALLQADFSKPLIKNKPINIIIGAQFIQQNSLQNGGNQDISKTYIIPGSNSQVFGGRLGIENRKQWLATVNFTYMDNDYRYLMPREWGRDPFYTFMSRERNEGYGKLTAINGELNLTFLNEKLSTIIAAGKYLLPDVGKYELNKYNMPSYDQVNFGLRFHPKGYFHGMELQFLLAYKRKIAKTTQNIHFEHNKVNMTNYNLIINYNF